MLPGLRALAHATERRVLAERARAIRLVAHERRGLVRIPAPVLAEVCRVAKPARSETVLAAELPVR
jgi:hypothetical protein